MTIIGKHGKGNRKKGTVGSHGREGLVIVVRKYGKGNREARRGGHERESGNGARVEASASMKSPNIDERNPV